MIDPLGIALPTLRRLPLYLRLFEERKKDGDEWLSSETIARHLDFRAIQVRKDLSVAGALGSPKRGFPVDATAEILKKLLRADEYVSVFLVGTGPLAYGIFQDNSVCRYGFEIAAMFQPDEDQPLRYTETRKVFPISKLPGLSRRMGIKLAILAIDENWMPRVLEILADSDICGIVDLTDSSFVAPQGLTVVRVSLGSSLAKLVSGLRKEPRERDA